MKYAVLGDVHANLEALEVVLEDAARRGAERTVSTGDIVGYRMGDYKLVFKEQRAHGLQVWQDPYVALRMPKVFNLRMDPFERMDHEGSGYDQWMGEHMFLFAPAMGEVAKFKATFKEFPQRQKPGAFVP